MNKQISGANKYIHMASDCAVGVAIQSNNVKYAVNISLCIFSTKFRKYGALLARKGEVWGFVYDFIIRKTF